MLEPSPTLGHLPLPFHLSFCSLSPILAATFMPPQGLLTLDGLSPAASSSDSSLFLGLVLRRRRRLPIPCSRCFSRLSALSTPTPRCPNSFSRDVRPRAYSPPANVSESGESESGTEEIALGALVHKESARVSFPKAGMLSSTAQSGGLLPWLIQAGLTFRVGPDPDGFQAAIVGIGNDAGDLDSLAASIAIADWQPVGGCGGRPLWVPIAPFPRSDFRLRQDACLLFNHIGFSFDGAGAPEALLHLDDVDAATARRWSDAGGLGLALVDQRVRPRRALSPRRSRRRHRRPPLRRAKAHGRRQRRRRLGRRRAGRHAHRLAAAPHPAGRRLDLLPPRRAPGRASRRPPA